MARKTDPKYYARQYEWKKENMKMVGAIFKKDFVDEYKQACKKLGIKQSEPIRVIMQHTINEAKGKKAK